MLGSRAVRAGEFIAALLSPVGLAAINACEKLGRWGEALALPSKLLAGRIDADIITYNAATIACEKKAGSGERHWHC